MLRFTIIDYTTNPLGDSTVIDEPVGWDGINLRLKRDKVWHGFFDFADDTLSSLQFVNSGYGILNTAYETYGASANVQLLIEFQCAEGDDYNQLYLGRFVFSTYKDIRGDECLCEITVEAVNCLMIFRNRYDQQVDLDSLEYFDTNQCDNFSLTNVYIIFTASTSFTIIGETIANTYIGQYLKITGTTYNNGTFLITAITPSGADTIITVDSVRTLELGVYGNLKSYCLVPYSALGKEISLPSKEVALFSEWKVNDTTVYDLGLGARLDLGIHAICSISPDIPDIVSDIDTTYVGTGVPSQTAGFFPDSPPDELIKWQELQLVCNGNASLEITLDGALIPHDGCDPINYNVDQFFFIVNRGFTWNPASWAGQTTGPNKWVFPLSDSFSLHTVIDFPNLQPGETVWARFTVEITNDGTHGSPNCAPDLQLNAGSGYKMVIESVCDSTPASLYLINETLSRCTEAYTNDCMRVYSDYFGRTDAQPYPSGSDGCGGLRAVTNGLRIRNAPNSDGQTPQRVTTSMQDMFNALNATDNIGMGLEVDPNRADHKLIRVEPYEYFYNNTILMTCDSIRKVNRQTDASLIFSTIKMGYDKWKTWNINGLNDIFTPRNYRTELAELKNELDKTCKFIASDYAIEWTRRQYGLTTADSRYDNDMFFVCLTRQPYEYDVTGHFIGSGLNIIDLVGIDYKFSVGDDIQITGTASNNATFTIIDIEINTTFNTTALVVASGVTNESTVNFHILQVNVDYNVEQGLDSPTNILYPDTVMNYRLAPSRNAMRWMKTILQSYRNFIDKSIRFTSGEGNILGSGEVLTPCRLESHVIAENQDLSLDDFDSPEDNYPLFYPELVSFEYPMSYEQYLTIYANPYGLIEYQAGNGAIEHGWIEDMQYSPYNGLVNFTLRPKIV